MSTTQDKMVPFYGGPFHERTLAVLAMGGILPSEHVIQLAASSPLKQHNLSYAHYRLCKPWRKNKNDSACYRLVGYSADGMHLTWRPS